MTSNGPQRSWLPYPADHPFPVQNLPYGAFRLKASAEARPCVRIADLVLDLAETEKAGLLSGCATVALFQRGTLNAFMAQGRAVWSAVRRRIQELLSGADARLRDDTALRERTLIPLERVELCLPVEIGDYTDFYSSKQHAFNVGTMFRGAENALMPNYLWMPIGYHGRASSIVLSGTPIRRPSGQTNANDGPTPEFGPSKSLDFELEMGFFVGPGNELGRPIPIDDADDHIFGMAIVNDWSARDIQRWEYQPLGPFLSKNFATSISPWIVPMGALTPFRVPPGEQQPAPLPYLARAGVHVGSADIQPARGETQGGAGPSPAPGGAGILPAQDSVPGAGWTYDIQLEVALTTEKQSSPHVISRSNFRHLYWTMAQQLAHHTITGCNLRPGDLLASGTISGPTEDSFGSMLELAWKGTKPIKLPGGEERKFIQDGDTVTMRAWCEGQGYRIGFGQCAGRVMAAHDR